MLINFGYVIDNEIAGLGHPDSFGDVEEALVDLQSRGIGALISLDENGIQASQADGFGILYKHIPIPDFHPPEMAQAQEFVQFATECRSQGKQVGVHCRGGYGRTGTLIACYLISQGMTAQKAMDTVRRKRPGSIETAGQENFLKEFEAMQKA